MKRLLVLLAAGSLLLSACGGAEPSEDPRGALKTALDNMAEIEGAAVVLSLESDTASLQALSSEGGSPLDEESAQKVLDSSIEMKSKGEGVEGQFELLANIAGEEDLELKFVD